MTDVLPINFQPPEGILRDRITAHLDEMAAMPPMAEVRLVDLRTAAVMEMRQFGWQSLAECVAEIDRLRALLPEAYGEAIEIQERGDA
jgi:predicted amidohydrolase YtcJ